MKVVSIDLELTGLDPETCQVIEFAAVCDDLSVRKPLADLPRFQRFVAHPHYHGQPRALAMHARIFSRLADHEEDAVSCPDVVFAKNLAWQFSRWLHAHGWPKNDYGRTPVLVAGKNFAGTDLPFLRKLPSWTALLSVHRRVIDPGTLYLNPWVHDLPPDTAECLRLAGLQPSSGAHEALGDALDVVRLLRHHYLHQTKEEAA